MSVRNQSRINRREFIQKTGTAVAGTSLFLSSITDHANATDSSQKPMARTLLGDIPPDEIGMALVHVHLTVDWSEMYTPGVFGPFDDAKREEIISKISSALNDYRTKYLGRYGGKGTIVDCTPIRVGRFPKLYREIAKRSNVHIIGMSGFFGESFVPMHIECARLFLQPNGLEKMAEFFIKEIREGMEDPYHPFGTRFTDVKAGILKAATSNYMTPLEEASHRGVALASVETGCPITTHTHDGGGMEQVELFLSMGVKPDNIAIGHLGYKDDRVNEVALDYVTRIADKGCYVEFDRHGGNYKIENYIKLVTHLKKRGFLDRILVGWDVLPYSYKGRNKKNKTPADWTANGERAFDFPLLVRDYRPAFLEAGLTEDEVTMIFVDNPRRYLAF